MASGCSSEQSQNKQLVNNPDSPALKLKAAKQTEYPLVLKDACGEEVAIPSEPQRVAVDNDELKDFMKVIGASDKIVEVTEDSASSLWERGYNRSFSKNNQLTSIGVGKNTLEDDLLATAGGENILPWIDDQSPDSFPTTLEQLRKADPDLILYQHYFRSPEYVPPKEREEWQSLRAIRTTSQLYVYPFDEMRYSDLPDNLMALLKAIHPEAYSRITVNN